MRSLRVTVGLFLALAVLAGGCRTVEAPAVPEAARPVRVRRPTPQQIAVIDDAQRAKEVGDYDTALSLFQEILAENPTITTAYLGIGDIYLIKEDYARAEPAYHRAARIEPQNFDAQYGHGLALQMLRRFVEAVRAYERALTVRPNSARANLNLATTFLQLGAPERALAYAERAAALDAASGPSHANLGAIYESLGRNAEAIDQFIAALELMGNDPRLMMNLISVQIKELRFREAANTAETLARIEPSAAAAERLGHCYFKLRRFEASKDAYRRAVDIDDAYWPALNGIGVNALNTWILSKKRDPDAKSEAGDAFRRSLRANPDQPKVVQLILNYKL